MDKVTKIDQSSVDELYEEAGYWHVNTGDQIIHAKRMSGRFRTIKWYTATVWLIYFLGPYLRWGDRQAVLFDIPNRKFHIFDITIMPQDVWLLAMILLFFAIMLAAVTSIAGRVFCGYFCFQTIWTDIYTFIEEKIEGSPAKRHKLDKMPWNAEKIRKKVIKHSLWLLIGMLTGIAFTTWFTDAYEIWGDYFTLEAGIVAWTSVLMFTLGTYILAGFMREQTCFWLCPYARIQGVMYDTQTILPTYDINRGEPRGRLVKGNTVEGNGDCISCNQCVAVCPTGIDIRHGQQEGCITCGLCLDACDSVMDKIGKPRGLIRYSSHEELQGKKPQPLHKRPRVIIYFSIMLLAASGLLYGLTNLGTFDLKVIHERQPLFVKLSNGSIQNKYILKILNKTDKNMHISIDVDGPENLQTQGLKEKTLLPSGKLSSFTIFIRIPMKNLEDDRTPVKFTIHSYESYDDSVEYQSMFYAPKF
ncbi:MAG: cytochrome c oxidase accessory protein CcoG [Gammaproteobacteria bacterium]|nr:cytochrome c oxidase accessory protein CcoG [Gammaproteobacteria bacterium]MCW8911025.1 cytochrome c oxidase accessory protein CcoG [Gammaproteobacteria bacterium]MCW9005125.1 cytochrome c oxidase accessory protein CcoG [Gammaproteobacteria bacterium]MCW9056639.1 cytochrome c oxidase accessory protein CcoG [Gammaproteobacteria bacterium]